MNEPAIVRAVETIENTGSKGGHICSDDIRLGAWKFAHLGSELIKSREGYAVWIDHVEPDDSAPTR